MGCRQLLHKLTKQSAANQWFRCQTAASHPVETESGYNYNCHHAETDPSPSALMVSLKGIKRIVVVPL